MINFQPASEQLISTTPSVNNSVYVLSVEQSIIYVKTIDPKLVLALGQRINFSDSIGLVTNILDTRVAVKLVAGNLDAIFTDKAGIIDSIGELPIVRSKVIDSTKSLGSLNIKCSVPSYHKAGWLGWSLYHNSELLVVGNDLAVSGSILYTGGESWSPGEYTLLVSLFEPDTFSLQRSRTKRWILDVQQGYVGIGNAQDQELPFVI
jgi:hypothetical protein